MRSHMYVYMCSRSVKYKLQGWFRRREDNIKLNLKWVEYEDLHWNYSALDEDQYGSCEYGNDPWRAGDFLKNEAIVATRKARN
jgi:hypothetical protein